MIDDDAAVREIVELILTDAGYGVRSASNISTALALVQQRQPDLILLDLTLPGPGGEGFITAYRQLPNANARIVVMSGRVDVEQRLATIGADGVLAKPFELDALLTTVGALLAPRLVLDVEQQGLDSPSVGDDPASVACCGE